MKKPLAIEIIYKAAQKMYKPGKKLPLKALAEKAGYSMEYVRKNVVILVKHKLIKRNKVGRIIEVK